MCPGLGSMVRGSRAPQGSKTAWQRGWKWQPEGGFTGLLSLLTDDRISLKPTCLITDKDSANRLLDEPRLIAKKSF